MAVEGERLVSSRSMDGLPGALENMEEIAVRLEGRCPMIALDYDGTLTPIVERPDLARLSREMRSVVGDLARFCTVAVISGRDLDDVRRLVGLEELFYAGSHGFDIAGPAGRQIASRHGAEFLPLLDRAEKALAPLLEGVEGVLLERKKLSLAVHYRMVEESRVCEVEKAVDRVLKGYPGLRKGTGKKVFELQPGIGWHKGKALFWLMEVLNMEGPDVVPVYIGDDMTDEDAFRDLRSRGLGIVVRGGDDGGGCSRPTAASYALKDCAQVRLFLEKLAKLLRGRK